MLRKQYFTSEENYFIFHIRTEYKLTRKDFIHPDDRISSDEIIERYKKGEISAKELYQHWLSSRTRNFKFAEFLAAFTGYFGYLNFNVPGASHEKIYNLSKKYNKTFHHIILNIRVKSAREKFYRDKLVKMGYRFHQRGLLVEIYCETYKYTPYLILRLFNFVKID